MTDSQMRSHLRTSIPPVRSAVTVPWPQDAAFRRFTEDMGSWWPLETHSIAPGESETVVVEPREGGRVFERQRGGPTALWGTVRVWEPPRRFVIDWHPGYEPEKATQVEVTFTPDASGGTRVELTHSGWERLLDKAEDMRNMYEGGWDAVLALYAGSGAAG